VLGGEQSAGQAADPHTSIREYRGVSGEWEKGDRNRGSFDIYRPREHKNSKQRNQPRKLGLLKNGTERRMRERTEVERGGRKGLGSQLVD